MPSSARALASGPASSARPATSFAASSSASSFAPASSPQTSASSSGGSSREVRGGERVQAGDDGRVELVLDPLGERRRLGGRQHAVLRERSSARDREHRRRADRLAQVAGGVERRLGLDASTTRSAPRTASSFVAPSAPSSRPPPRARARRRASRSRRRRPASTSRFASARPKLPGAADDRDLHAGGAPSTASASRRDGVEVGHQRPRHDRPDGERRRRGVGLVDDERVDQARRSRPRRAPESCRPPCRASIRSAGPLTARPPTSGLTATHGTRRAASAARISATARIGQMLTYGLLGAITISVGAGERLEHARGGPRRRPRSGRASTSSRWPRATNHSWNGKLPAGVSIQVRSRSSVAGRIAASIPSARGEPRRHRRERLAGAQRLRAHEVQAEVAVAEPEPVLAAERRDGRRARARSRPRGPSRAPRRAGRRARRGCCRGRARPQAEHLEVVADVADHRHVRRIDGADEPAREAGAADAAGEERDLHSAASRPSAACVRGRRGRAARGRRACRRRRRGSDRRGDVVASPDRASSRRGAKRSALPARRAARRARRRKRERVRRPVRGLDEPRRRARRAGERPEVVRDDAREVRVDDEHQPRPVERGGDRRPWPPPGSSTTRRRARPRARARRHRRDEQRAARPRRTRRGRRRASRARAPTELVRSVQALLARAPRKGTTICAIG